jgi:hypothetical protein
MPAVQLEVLETHISNLAWKFTRPDEFQQSLAHLLTFYSEQVYRPGTNVTRKFAQSKYRVPQIVLANIERKLTDWCKENPDSAHLLAEQLRRDDFYEPRLLAAHILGQLPGDKFPLVLDIVKSWAEAEKDRAMLDQIFMEASYNIRNHEPELWIELSNFWLASKEYYQKNLGTRALIPLARDRNFINLPNLYQIITPLLAHPNLSLQNDLLQLMEVLIKRIPNEVSYLLKDILQDHNEAPVHRLFRKLLPMFPSNIQRSLRESLTSQAG